MIGPKRVKLTASQERAAYDAVTERDQGRCQRCGRMTVVHRDHRQNRDAFNTVVCNLQLLCALTCHPWKSTHPEQATLDGFSVPRWARPELWPAWRVGVGWVLYDDEGRWREITESTAHLLMRGGG